MFKPPHPPCSLFRRIAAVGTALAVISIGPGVGLGIGSAAADEKHQALDSRIAGLEARIADRASDPKDPPPVDPKDPPPVDPKDPADDPQEPVPADPPVDEPQDDEPDFKVFNGLAIGLTVTAGLLLATGAGLGGASLARTRAANEGCEDIEGGTYCMTDVEGDVDASRNLAIGSDVTLGIGAAVGIAAIVVIAIRAKKKKQLRSSAYVIPSGLGLAGRF